MGPKKIQFEKNALTPSFYLTEVLLSLPGTQHTHNPPFNIAISLTAAAWDLRLISYKISFIRASNERVSGVVEETKRKRKIYNNF